MTNYPNMSNSPNMTSYLSMINSPNITNYPKMANYPKWQTIQIWQVRSKTSGGACSRHPWGHFPTHPLHTGAQEFKFFILFFHLTFILLLEHILSIFLSKTSLFFRPLPDVSFVFPTEEKLFSIPSFINSLGHFSFPRSSNGHGKRLQEEVVEFFYIPCNLCQ